MFVDRTLRTAVKIVVIDIERTRRMRTVFESQVRRYRGQASNVMPKDGDKV